MNDFSDKAQTVLDLARGVDNPSDADRARLESGLTRRLGAAALAGSGLAATQVVSAAAPVVGVASGIKVFVVLGALVAAVSAGGVIAWRGHRDGQPLRRPSVSAHHAVDARPTAARIPVTANEPPPTQNSSSDALAAESAVLVRAEASLHQGEPERALALLDSARAQFRAGFLGEERDVARIEALCALHRADDAQTAATAFDRDHPGSPLANRARRGCAGAPNR